ncbi:MAG TPA: MarR family transcriptional regulator [Sedimentibacter sp.]|jgi:DNA-binding MarR family transcriptional regulator|nr:MarR family transcriptional regulator [Sedimentibacter sp.]HOK49443.1 MarR family transcriptional regulator [Sedimentibacter sp.]HRC81797.1 MarR family transcriptional regulator [Sedimentibacter sp.]
MNELQKKAYIFATIFTLSNRLQTLGDEFDKNFTTKQWLFIVAVSRFKEPPTITEVANFIGYSRQNAKRIAADLEKAGHIMLQKDENDARALRITINPQCMEYFKKRDKREIEFLEQVFEGFDEELTNNVYEGIVKLEQNVKAMGS